MTTTETDRRVLLVTADRSLTQRGERIIAAARRTVVSCGSSTAAAHWASAEAVLVGVDQLEAMTKVDPPRRPNVFAIASSAVPDRAWRDCVALGVTDALVLDESEGWLVDRLTLSTADDASGFVVRVRGAAGGVGASTLAAGLALAAPEGPVVLVDTERGSGWLDLLLGIEMDGLGWAELTGLRGRVGGDALTASVPTRDGISLVMADRDGDPVDVGPEALRTAVLAGAGLGGLVVIDDVGGELSATAGRLADATVVVTSSDLRGGLAARRELEELTVANRPGEKPGPIVVAARTRRRSALPTTAFRELVDLADGCFWISEIRSAGRRIGRGLPGLRERDRFVRDCRGLLELLRTDGAAR